MTSFISILCTLRKLHGCQQLTAGDGETQFSAVLSVRLRTDGALPSRAHPACSRTDGTVENTVWKEVAETLKLLARLIPRHMHVDSYTLRTRQPLFYSERH